MSSHHMACHKIQPIKQWAGVYGDLCDFLLPLAANNLLNKIEQEPYIDSSNNLAYHPKISKRKINNFVNWLEA